MHGVDDDERTVMADYDRVVIGSGPAGEKGAVQAAYFGKHVAIVERAPEPGGAAVHTGTLPSKTLREAAIYLSGYRARDLYGISVDLDATRAAPSLLSRKDTVRDLEVGRIRWNLERHGVAQLSGRARFADPLTLEVASPAGAQRLTAERFLIATGSKTYRPEEIDFSDPYIHDSDTVLALKRLPGSVMVVAGGVICCAYATVFA